jgi:hypothetical protein
MGRKPQSRTTRASRGVALSPVWLSKRETKRKRSMPSSLAQIWCVRLGCVTGSKNCRRQAFIRSDSAITRWPWRSGIRSRRCFVAQFALFDNGFMRFSRTFDSISILPLITRQSPRNLIVPRRARISRGSPVIDHLANLERVVSLQLTLLGTIGCVPAATRLEKAVAQKARAARNSLLMAIGSIERRFDLLEKRPRAGVSAELRLNGLSGFETSARWFARRKKRSGVRAIRTKSWICCM